MALITDRALCLTRHPWSESSLVVHALTREHGRVHLLARGAYRTTSRYFAVLDLFDELEIEWSHSPRRELQELRAGSIVTRRKALRASLPAYRAAVTVLELADLAARFDRSDSGLFVLADDALHALESGADSPATSLVRFELAFLAHLGLAPSLVACAACGQAAPPVVRRPEERAAFSAGAGGRLCRRCAEEARASGRRVGTLPVRVLEHGHRLAEPRRSAFAHPRIPLRDDTQHGAKRSTDPRVTTGGRTDEAGAELEIERVRDFVGRFLDYHLETRPRSQRAFLSVPNRNAAPTAARTRRSLS